MENNCIEMEKFVSILFFSVDPSLLLLLPFYSCSVRFFFFLLAIHLVIIMAFFISLMIKRGNERENEYLLEPEDTKKRGIVLSSYGNVLS